jgi:hypothetical protein
MVTSVVGHGDDEVRSQRKIGILGSDAWRLCRKVWKTVYEKWVWQNSHDNPKGSKETSMLTIWQRKSTVMMQVGINQSHSEFGVVKRRIRGCVVRSLAIICSGRKITVISVKPPLDQYCVNISHFQPAFASAAKSSSALVGWFFGAVSD